MKIINAILILLFIITVPGNINAWELYDRVIATVNETPIIESEITKKFNRITSNKKVTKKKIIHKKSRLLDKSIEEILVEQTAQNESIIVSEAKIENQIQKIMERMNIKSIELFRKKIEKTEKITFDEYKEEMRKSLIAEQVMSIAIGISPPSTKDAENWYKNNKTKMGYEVNIQHILLKIKNESFAENKRASKIASDLYKKIKKGQSFATIAKKHSEDTGTKDTGGKLGWVPLSNLAKQDMILANNIYKEFVISKKKQGIIKSNSGYHIIKYKGKRATSFNAVKGEILNLLYQQRMAEQFKKWVYQRRLKSDVKIYMEKYIEEKIKG